MNSEYNEDYQKLLIESIISSPDIFSRCQSILDPSYFNKNFQKSVKFIIDFTEKYKSMPTSDQIYVESGIKFSFIENVNQEHQQYFLDEIEQFIKHQALRLAILHGADLLEKGEYQGIEQTIKDALLVGLQKSLGINYFDNPRERLIKLKDSNGKLSTGWKSLDAKLYGVNRKELLIFCAPSGGGKSVALQNLALNMALQSYNVVYFSLELSEELCSLRLDSMLTGIKSSEIFKKLDDVELSVMTTSKRIGAGITFKKFKSGTTTLDFRSYIKEYQLQNGFKPDVILVDYIDLMMPNNKKISPENLFIKDKFVTEELRDLAEELNALVASASQLGRSAIDQPEFNHSHIAGGISKINTADNVIGIFNSPRSRERNEIEFQLMKTRNSGGLDQKITLCYDVETLRITDMPEGMISNGPKKSDIMDRINNRKPSKSQEDTPIVEEDPIKRMQSLTNLMNKVKGN